MDMATEATEQAGVRTVEATINYVARGSFINRRFVAPGVEHNTGRYEAHPVEVRDGRALREELSLEVQGFRLADRPSAVTDFFDREQVDRLYPGEVVEIVRSLTGATRVAPLGWMIRTSGDVARHQRPAKEGVSGSELRCRADEREHRVPDDCLLRMTAPNVKTRRR
jgi:hypothetical protein